MRFRRFRSFSNLKAAVALGMVLVDCGAHGIATPHLPDRDWGDAADEVDRCFAIRPGCGDTDDGCPSTVVRMGADCTVSSDQSQTLSEVVRDLGEIQRPIVVRVASADLSCANAVRDELIQRGVDAARLEVGAQGADTDVHFEVASWNGARCSTLHDASTMARIASPDAAAQTQAQRLTPKACDEALRRRQQLIASGKTSCLVDANCGTYYDSAHPCGTGTTDRATAEQLQRIDDALQVDNYGCFLRAQIECSRTPYNFRAICGRNKKCVIGER